MGSARSGVGHGRVLCASREGDGGRLIVLCIALCLGVVLDGCRSGGAGIVGPADSPSSSRPVEWSYHGDAAPDRWAALSPAYAACAREGTQSPIDLASPTDARGAADFRIDYRRSGLRIAHHQHVTDILDNGHTIQVTVEEGSQLATPRDVYALKQFHFHTPAEHTIDGRAYPMEIHFVHQSPNGRFAVVSALVEVGAPSPSLARLIEHLPGRRGEVVDRPEWTIDPGDHFTSMTAAYSYTGSLTTPPCSEGVEWIVMSTPLPASRDQIAAFAGKLGRNARPIQPRGDRAPSLRPLTPKLWD